MLPASRRFHASLGLAATSLATLALADSLASLAMAGPSPEPPRPNLLVIIADDLGYSDLGCYGGEIATPRLDALAEGGLRYTDFYNTGRCWPTRSSLLTGYYAQQIRRDSLPDLPQATGNHGIRPEWAILLPEMLRQAGYRSYHSGKWHLDGMPLEGGFDRSYYLLDQGRFFSPQAHWLDDEPLPPVDPESGYYGTTALADHTIEVLREHAAEHPGRPFFHYLAFAAPHFPLHALPEDIAHYEGRYDEGWDRVRARRWARISELGLLDPVSVPAPSRWERHVGAPYWFDDAYEILGPGEVPHPLPWSRLTPEQQAFQAAKMELHAAMVHRMDLEIGRVLDQIKAMGQLDNTLVLFLSDNGASSEIMVRSDGHDPDAAPGSAASYLCLGPGWSTVCNTPFRRHKTWTHEGGTATPLVVSWPAGIPARGELRRAPGHVIDFVPTFLELAGLDPGEHLPGLPPLPGRSLVPSFAQDRPAGSGEAHEAHEALWWYHDGHQAILQGGWKAVALEGQPWELYRFETDRIEEHDLALLEPERLASLVAEWERRLADYTELAARDLPEALPQGKGKGKGKGRAPGMREAQLRAQPPTGQVLPQGESFLLAGRRAFVLTPEGGAEVSGAPKPWIFYAPALRRYPDEHERAMHERFLASGLAVAGIDVGEAYGSPAAFAAFEALYEEMASRGYSARPALLGRSRGGLWVSSWAAARPDRVAAIGGIYPVFDFTTYPGAEVAAPAYGLDTAALLEREADFNPVKLGHRLAAARIPVHLIHGTDDTVVPLEPNSGALESAYREGGAAESFTLERVEGQGHNFWRGFFESEALIEFLIREAKRAASR